MSTTISQFPITVILSADLASSTPSGSDKLLTIQGGVLKQASISSVVSSSPPAFSDITSKPTTLSGYGIQNVTYKCIISLANGISISSTSGTALTCSISDNFKYFKQTGFSGNITINDDVPASGVSGTLKFIPDSDKTYCVKIYGTVYGDAQGTIGVNLEPTGGGIGVVALCYIISGGGDYNISGGNIISGSLGTLTLKSFQPPPQTLTANISYGFVIEITQLN